jgi:hypothetical protein
MTSKMDEIVVGEQGYNGLAPGTQLGFVIWCPGCEEPHAIYTAGPTKWAFNGNRERPTFTPSLLVHGDCRPGGYRCHSFITDGKIQFLNDCGHKLKGQTVELPPYPEEWRS